MTAIEVQKLDKYYGEQAVLQDISFTVAQDEIFGLIGPNGAGKTTLVETIAGLRQPDAGTISVLGMDPRKDRTLLRRRLGIQLQASQLPDKIKVWEALDWFSAFYERPVDWEEILAALGLEAKRNATFDKLSGGQKQRLSIALALVGRPDILILDELTTGLDPEARRNIWRFIEQVRAQGVTILLVSHFMEEAERLCDRLAVIQNGRFVALDTPAGIVAQVGGQQRVRFRPSVPLEEDLLKSLPEVQRVTRHGATVTVAGTGNLLQAITATLARSQIIMHELRVEQATLDDAFITLTGGKLNEGSNGGAA